MDSDKKKQEKPEDRSEDIGPEHLDTRPGKEHEMDTKPIYDDDFPGAHRLQDKVAIITGGDSGIGRAVAVAYGKEGARVVIVYKEESKDAEETLENLEQIGAEAIAVAGDVADPEFCEEVVTKALDAFGEIHILVNNAGEQHPQKDFNDISDEQLEQTFQTNVFGMFRMVHAVLPHLQEGASIINTASITGYAGSGGLVDYASTKGAITAFTRSLAQNLAPKKIRVNQVAPGPIWTPLIPSTFGPDDVESFGEDTLMQRAGQPIELAEAFIFFAWARASSYITGTTIHINGGKYMSD